MQLIVDWKEDEGWTAVVAQELDGPMEGWQAQLWLWLDEEANRVEVTEISLVPPDGFELADLSGTAGRHLLLSHVAPELIKRFSNFRDIGLESAEAWLMALMLRRRQGRRRSPDGWYLLWAQRRVEAQEEAPDAPVAWMAEKYGETKPAIDAFLHRARNRGLLEGRRSEVHLTEKAVAMLAKEAAPRGQR